MQNKKEHKQRKRKTYKIITIQKSTNGQLNKKTNLQTSVPKQTNG